MLRVRTSGINCYLYFVKSLVLVAVLCSCLLVHFSSPDGQFSERHKLEVPAALANFPRVLKGTAHKSSVAPGNLQMSGQLQLFGQPAVDRVTCSCLGNLLLSGHPLLVQVPLKVFGRPIVVGAACLYRSGQPVVVSYVYNLPCPGEDKKIPDSVRDDS
jgi:hypothetical protein